MKKKEPKPFPDCLDDIEQSIFEDDVEPLEDDASLDLPNENDL